MRKTPRSSGEVGGLCVGLSPLGNIPCIPASCSTLPHPPPPPTHTHREACGVLEKLGYETHVEDSALGMIRAEVCRLGTGRAIRTTIMASDKAAITDYVLERPKEIPSTRDYLNDKLRFLAHWYALSRAHVTLPPPGTSSTLMPTNVTLCREARGNRQEPHPKAVRVGIKGRGLQIVPPSTHNWRASGPP